MDSDGGNSKQLAASLERDVRNPQWSADGKTIYFLSDDRGGSQLYAARLDGTVKAITVGSHRLGSGYATSDPSLCRKTAAWPLAALLPLNPRT